MSGSEKICAMDSNSEKDSSRSSSPRLLDCYSDNDDDAILHALERSDLFNRQSSPTHWATLSDTITVTSAGLPALKVLVCSGIETQSTLTAIQVVQQQAILHQPQPTRSKSVSNLDEEKQKLTEEDVIRMRNKFLNLARNRQLFQQLGSKQKWTLVVICLVYFFSYCAISVLAPFFHNIAIQHGISTSTYGLIFSVHPAVVFCTSPFIGQMIPSIGPKFMFLCGIFLCGTCNLLFGTLEFIQDDTQFLVFCFLVRGMAAVGASAFSTAGATYVADLFPDKISAVMGILETFVGLGFSIGPVIGGAFYSLGGFQLPFYALGSMMLITLPFSAYLLPITEQLNQNSNRKLGSKIFYIFKIPAVFIVCLVVAISSSAWSVIEPTLVIHMKQFNLPTVQLGSLFLVTSASYALSSPFWGWIADKYDHGNFMMISGLTATALSLFLLGPSPIFVGLPNVLWLNILSLVLLGVFVALAYVPTYHALLQYAVQVGCDTEMSTYSIIAGLWASMYSLGEVIGPTVGSILVDVYDFPIAMTAVAFMNLGLAIIFLLYCTCAKIGRPRLTATHTITIAKTTHIGKDDRIEEQQLLAEELIVAGYGSALSE